MMWQEKALCDGQSDLFDAEHSEYDETHARWLCEHCPVFTQCRTYADTVEPEERPPFLAQLVWAGETPEERFKRRVTAKKLAEETNSLDARIVEQWKTWDQNTCDRPMFCSACANLTVEDSQYGARGLCSRCYRRGQRMFATGVDRKVPRIVSDEELAALWENPQRGSHCPGCGRAVRGKKDVTVLGTVVVAARGLCDPCVKHARETIQNTRGRVIIKG